MAAERTRVEHSQPASLSSPLVLLRSSSTPAVFSLSFFPVCVRAAGFSACPQAEAVAHWPARCPLTSSTRTTTACSRWSSTWGSRWRGTSQFFPLACVVPLHDLLSSHTPFLINPVCLCWFSHNLFRYVITTIRCMSRSLSLVCVSACVNKHTPADSQWSAVTNFLPNPVFKPALVDNMFVCLFALALMKWCESQGTTRTHRRHLLFSFSNWL